MTLQRLSATNEGPAGRYCAWRAAASSGLAWLKIGRQRGALTQRCWGSHQIPAPRGNQPLAAYWRS